MVPVLNLTCPLLPPLPALCGAATILLDPPLICVGLLDVVKSSAQELVDEEEEKVVEEDGESGPGYGIGDLRTSFGDNEETLGGGEGGYCCVFLCGGDDSRCFLVTISP